MASPSSPHSLVCPTPIRAYEAIDLNALEGYGALQETDIDIDLERLIVHSPESSEREFSAKSTVSIENAAEEHPEFLLFSKTFNKPITPFIYDPAFRLDPLYRKGAYSYSDLSKALINSSYDRLSRARGNGVLQDNLQMLINELSQLKERVEPQFKSFSTLVTVYTRIQYSSDALDRKIAVLQEVKETLQEVKEFLRENITVIQERMVQFQPMSQLCLKIMQRDIQGLSLVNLNGKEYVRVPGDPDQADNYRLECEKMRRFYSFYINDVLQSHFTYFSKFLTAAIEFEMDVSVLKENLDSWKE